MATLNFPSSPSLNQIYSANNKSWIWDGVAWNAYSGVSGNSITTSTTAPLNPENGDLWFNTENGLVYVYYVDANSQQWVAPDNSGGGSSGSMIFLASATASSSAEILFDNMFNPSLYSEYVLKMQGVLPATDNVAFRVQLRNSVPANITDFHRGNRFVSQVDATLTGGGGNNGGTTGWELFPGAGNATNELSSITVQIQPITGQWTHMYAIGYITNNAGNRFSVQNAGACEGTTAPAGVRIYMSSGNISIGTFQLYGIKK